MVRPCPKCGKEAERIFIRTIKGRKYVIARHYVTSVRGKPRYHEWSLGPLERAPPEVLSQLKIPHEISELPTTITLTREEMIAFHVKAISRKTKARYKPEKYGLSWEELEQAWQSLKSKIPNPVKR